MKIKGFTLVETIIGIFIFSMTMLLISSLFITSLAIQKRSKQVTTKNIYRSNMIENGGQVTTTPYTITFPGKTITISK